MQVNHRVTSINSSTEGLNLIDIEPPTTPDFDWSIWGEWALWLLVVILVISVLLKWGNRLYKPAYLRWKLARLTSIDHQGECLPIEQAWRLYGVCLQIKQLINPTETRALQEFDCLMEQVNQLCFSNQTVSRETYLQLITQSKRIVTKHGHLKLDKNPILMALKAKLKRNH